MNKLYNSERVKLFTDAVVAIVLTLLVLEIKVPEIPLKSSNHQVFQNFILNQNQWVAYILSFWLISKYWTTHFLTFEKIKYITPSIVNINMLFIFSLTLIPFAASLSNFENTLSASLFSLSITFPAFCIAYLIRKVYQCQDLIPHVKDHHSHHHALYHTSAVIFLVGIVTSTVTLFTLNGLYLWFSCIIIMKANWSFLKLKKTD